MVKKYKNISIELIFFMTCLLWFSTELPSIAEIESPINYRPLKKTGVKILIEEFEVTNDNTFEFELSREDVSTKDYIWSVLWKKDFGFYLTGVDPMDKEISCPYVGEEEKQSGSDIKEIADGRHHITLVLTRQLIDAIIENGCAVSPKPRKTPKAAKNTQKVSKDNIFTVVYN